MTAPVSDRLAVRAGLAATRAPWAPVFRNYAGDHSSGLTVKTLLDADQLETSGSLSADVLLIDDTSRVFSGPAVAEAIQRGIFVIGLHDPSSATGREYLSRLGVQLLLPTDTPADQLVATVLSVVPASSSGADSTAVPSRGDPGYFPGESDGGVVSAWYSATGGWGATEAVVGVAEALARRQHRVVVVEAGEGAPVLSARLRRSSDTGLPWALMEVMGGKWALPGCLAAERPDGQRPLGGFDLVAQTSSSGATRPSQHAAEEFLIELRHAYDHVLVDVGTSPGPVVGGNPAAAALGSVLPGGADVVLVGAGADPIGALALGHWQASTLESPHPALTWAVMGRAARSRFSQEQLGLLVGDATGPAPFRRLWFLPEEPALGKARWNAELVTRGRWSAAISALADALARVPASAPHPEPALAARRRVETWGMVAAG